MQVGVGSWQEGWWGLLTAGGPRSKAARLPDPHTRCRGCKGSTPGALHCSAEVPYSSTGKKLPPLSPAGVSLKELSEAFYTKKALFLDPVPVSPFHCSPSSINREELGRTVEVTRAFPWPALTPLLETVCGQQVHGPKGGPHLLPGKGWLTPRGFSCGVTVILCF